MPEKKESNDIHSMCLLHSTHSHRAQTFTRLDYIVLFAKSKK